MNISDCLAIIPARYASTRFPGKPLARLGERTVIDRVVRQVEKCGIRAVVATDDERIARSVTDAGHEAVMTSPDHKSGTDRIAEAARILRTDASVIVNVQGDEPFIRPEQILALASCFDNPSLQIATLAKAFPASAPYADLADPNLVKVVISRSGEAIYFSRSVIPFMRGTDLEQWPASHRYLTHIGMYAYRREVLEEITRLPRTDLEKAESLEQLRWLENGYRIGVALSEFSTVGIDTPEDLRQAELYLRDNRQTFD